MKGTEKQIAWANEIVNKMVTAYNTHDGGMGLTVKQAEIMANIIVNEAKNANACDIIDGFRNIDGDIKNITTRVRVAYIAEKNQFAISVLTAFQNFFKK